MVASALDLDVDASRQIELHQCVQGLGGGLEDVDQALVSAHLELLARLLVDVRSTEHGVLADRGRQRNRSGDARAGAARGLHDVRRRLVEQLVIESLEANTNLCSVGHNYSMILVTTPAPTVLPPSRIAKRICSSRATVVMSSTSTVTLSPGITILTPSGSITEPVTSVVRM